MLPKLLILATTPVIMFASLFSSSVALAMILVGPTFEVALQSYVGILAARPVIFNVGLALICAASLGATFGRGQRPFQNAFNPASISMFLLVCLSLASLGWTAADADTRALVKSSIPYTILYCVVAPLLVSRVRDLRTTFFTVLVLGTAVAAAILLNPDATMRSGRIDIKIGVVDSINPLAVGYLGGVLFVTAVIYRPRKVAAWIMPARVGLAFMGIGVTLQSGSRGQLLITALMAIIFLPLSRKIQNFGRFVALSVGGVFALVAFRLAMGFFITYENEERWSFESLSDGGGGRIEMAATALGDLLQNPQSWLLGRGAGNFVTLDASHSYVHNFPIEALTELGIVGFMLFMFVVVTGFRSGRSLWLMYRDDDDYRMLVSTLLAVSSFTFLLSFKEGTIHDPGQKLFPLLLLARIARNEEQDAESWSEEAYEDVDEHDAGDDGYDAGDYDPTYGQDPDETPGMGHAPA